MGGGVGPNPKGSSPTLGPLSTYGARYLLFRCQIVNFLTKIVKFRRGIIRLSGGQNFQTKPDWITIKQMPQLVKKKSNQTILLRRINYFE